MGAPARCGRRPTSALIVLVLIRHPATVMPPGICHGRMDVSLAPDADLAGIVARLESVPAFSLWSSPAIRCMAVGDAIAEAYGVQVRSDGRLRELDFGEWEGIAWSQVPRTELDRWAACPMGFTPPGGESGAALVDRVSAFHAEIAARAGDHVVVSHGGPLRLLGALACGRAIDLFAAAPELGSVRIYGAVSSSMHAGDNAEDHALRDDFGSTENVAGVAADLPSREGGAG
jgi:alpha-ribazole phosphatase